MPKRYHTLNLLGILAISEEGDYTCGAELFKESLALAREAEDAYRVTASLVALQYVAVFLGNYDRAAALYEEALAVARELGNASVEIIPEALVNLGLAALGEGNHQRAGAGGASRRPRHPAGDLCDPSGGGEGGAGACPSGVPRGDRGSLFWAPHGRGDTGGTAGDAQGDRGLWRGAAVAGYERLTVAGCCPAEGLASAILRFLGSSCLAAGNLAVKTGTHTPTKP